MEVEFGTIAVWEAYTASELLLLKSETRLWVSRGMLIIVVSLQLSELVRGPSNSGLAQAFVIILLPGY